MPARSVVAVLLALLTGCQTIGSSQSALDAASRERLQARLDQLSAQSSTIETGTAPDTELQQSLREALELLDRGRDEDALTSLAAILRDHPEHTETIRLTAATARRIGDWRLQNAALRKLIELQPDSPVVLNQCGKALLQTNSEDGANSDVTQAGLAALRRAVELESANARFAHDLFAALAERQLDSEAEAVLEQASRNCPQDALLAMAAARYFEDRGRWPDAILQYGAAIKSSPREPLWRRERGMSFARLQQWDKACDDLQPALHGANAATLKTAFLTWADAAYQAGRYDEAATALDRLRTEADHRTPETEQQRIRSLLKLRQFDTATDAALQAMIDWPQNAELRQLVAELERLDSAGS